MLEIVKLLGILGFGGDLGLDCFRGFERFEIFGGFGPKSVKFSIGDARPKNYDRKTY